MLQPAGERVFESQILAEYIARRPQFLDFCERYSLLPRWVHRESVGRLPFADDLAAFADDLLLTFGMHQEIVYQSVAKLFYATCTDTQRAKAVGEELNTAGGIRLMRCAFYAFKWVVAKFLTDMEIEPWYAQVFYIYIEVAWDGVGEWKF